MTKLHKMVCIRRIIASDDNCNVTPISYSGWADPHYNKLSDNFYFAPNLEALKKASVEAIQYFAKGQINLALPLGHDYHFAQLWIKGGWWGQGGMGGGMLYIHFGRYWVDQDLKKQILGQ